MTGRVRMHTVTGVLGGIEFRICQVHIGYMIFCAELQKSRPEIIQSTLAEVRAGRVSSKGLIRREHKQILCVGVVGF